MEVLIERDAFDALQNFLAEEIIASVHRGLEELNLPRAKLEDVITGIAFRVCCAVDGSTIMEYEGRRVLPVLTFAESAEFERVISNGNTSFMHEYVHGIAEQYLDARA